MSDTTTTEDPDEQEPLTDFDAVNHAIRFYATIGHSTPAHAAIHSLFTQARQGKVIREWRCFHCDAFFTDPQLARDHFGADQLAEPVCQIPDLAHLLRLQEYELRWHREEDSQLIRRVAEVTSDHHRKLRDEEEKGYARGMRDVQKIVREKIEAEIARRNAASTEAEGTAIVALEALLETLLEEGAA